MPILLVPLSPNIRVYQVPRAAYHSLQYIVAWIRWLAECQQIPDLAIAVNLCDPHRELALHGQVNANLSPVAGRDEFSAQTTC
jgi:hypothetical protein